MSLVPGDILDGKYEILGRLGKGGMSVVYLAEHVRVRRQVAIKVLLTEAISSSSDAVMRFEREAQAAGRIGSEHIVEVMDIGVTQDGDRFMVMELLEGDSLKQRLAMGRLSPERAAAIFGQLLEGLAAAHAAAIVHRDIKPDNVFLQRSKAGQKDWVKILDFGISKFIELNTEEGYATRAGMVMGTLFYMSPEQMRSTESVDSRSDIYSVAVMLYESMTGQLPFRGRTVAELMFKIVFEPPAHPKSINPELDDEICAIILRGMQHEPAARFQTAGEFRAALEAWGARNQRPPYEAPASSQTFRAPAPEPMRAPSTPAPPPHVAAAALEPPTQIMARSTDSGVREATPRVPSNDTQQAWDQTKGIAAAPPNASRKLAALLAIPVALVIGGAVAFLALWSPAEPPSASQAPTQEPARVASPAPAESASPVSVTPVAAAIETAAAPNPSVETQEPARPASTAAPTTKPTAAKPTAVKSRPVAGPAGSKKGAGKVVTDYGY